MPIGFDRRSPANGAMITNHGQRGMAIINYENRTIQLRVFFRMKSAHYRSLVGVGVLKVKDNLCNRLGFIRDLAGAQI